MSGEREGSSHASLEDDGVEYGNQRNHQYHLDSLTRDSSTVQIVMNQVMLNSIRFRINLESLSSIRITVKHLVPIWSKYIL